MYARVWKLIVLPGNLEGFTADVKHGMSILRGQPGFRGLLVMHSGTGEGLEATIVSMWTTIDTLRNSETPAFKEALVGLLSHCERRPVMREEEVLVSEYFSHDVDDSVTRF